MTDENKEDEYQFAELDGNQVFDEDLSVENAGVSTSFGDNNLKKFIIIGVAGVLVLFLLYKFIVPFFESDDTKVSKAPTKQPVSQPKVTAPAPAPIKTVAVPKTEVFQQPKVQTVTKTIQDPQINEKLSVLQSSSRQASRNINQINNGLGSIKQTLDSMSSKINAMNTTISMLAQEVQNQQDVIKKLRQKPKKKIIKKRVVIPKKTYYIQAIIPGRAWLMSNKGDTITVVEGSVIRGWGKVKMIDPHQGQVVLASGKVIMFSASDT